MEMLYLINGRGAQVGNGTPLRVKMTGLQIRAEDGYDEDGVEKEAKWDLPLDNGENQGEGE